MTKKHDSSDSISRQIGALQERHDLLVELIDGSTDSIYVKDLTGRYLIVNAACARFVGLTPAEFIGKTDAELFAPEIAALFSGMDRKMIEGDAPVTYEDTNLHPDGLIHTYSTTKTPLRDENGKIKAVVGISRDITERRKIEEVRAIAAAAAAANKAKSQFLSRISHELRTPLNAVLGFAQLLQMDELSKEQRESVDYILHAGKHLLALVNEVLDISRIEDGQLTLSLVQVRLVDLIDAALQAAQPLAQERQIALAFDYASCSDAQVLVDPQRIEQVLFHLLSNAIIYNHEGGSVKLNCYTSANAAAGPLLHVEVADSGPGIALELQARLFTPFDRLNAAELGIAGTGLGLTLAKLLVEAMRGRIGFRSVPGAGSCFWFELPLV